MFVTTKQAENQENVPKPQKTLTNLYYDCLDRIMELLDFQSLLNLTDICAAHHFGEKFGNHTIAVGGLDNDLLSIVVNDDEIRTSRLKTSLALMRLFGTKKIKLVIKISLTITNNI